jgi:hypothetical protein
MKPNKQLKMFVFSGESLVSEPSHQMAKAAHDL